MAAVPDDPASAVVMAQAAVEASEWPKARNALAAFATTKPTRDMCLLMAEIEEGQNHDHGRAREWLARAATAPADPVWTADGMTFDEILSFYPQLNQDHIRAALAYAAEMMKHEILVPLAA